MQRLKNAFPLRKVIPNTSLFLVYWSQQLGAI